MGGHHFVVVHGLGHGAWCWYKVSALLQAQGHTVTALDMASGGIHKASADSITSVAQYLAPLTHFLAHSVTHHKVILVGHSLGGSSISYAMELFPKKICKAIFISALMPLSGSLFLPHEDLKSQSDAEGYILVNGSNNEETSRPTSIHMRFEEVAKYFYNKCSLEDVSLSRACLNPTPFALTKETLSLTLENYGSIPRFYISCLEDLVIPPKAQLIITQRNPPVKVLTIPQSDHSPFFCQVSTLVELLLGIANT